MRRSEAGRRDRDDDGERKVKRPPAQDIKITHDPVSESVIFAAACVDQKARSRLVGAFSTDSFFSKGGPEIWESITQLERQKLQYDPATMLSLGLEREHAAYLDKIVTQRPALPPNLQHHESALAWDQVRIEAARGPLQQFIEGLRDPQAEPDQVRALAQNLATSFTGQGILKYLRDPDQLLLSMSKAIRKRREGKACYAFGFDGFDQVGEGEDGEGDWRIVPGLAPQQVSLVTGVPGGGKSSFVLKTANNMARQGRRTLVGAFEMPPEYSIEVCGITDLGLSRKAFQTGQVTDEEEAQHLERCRLISGWVRFMDIPFGRVRGQKQFNDRNIDVLHSYIVESGAEVVIFDLFRRVLRQRDPEEEEIALERIQSVAKETNCHIILVQQQRAKDLEARADRRPTRESIKGSGAWFEVPDTIVGVHMPSLFKRVETETLEAIVLKQRHGKWPFAVEFDFDADRGHFGPGRGIDYVRPGEVVGMDAWVEGEKSAERQGKKGAADGKRKGGGRRRL